MPGPGKNMVSCEMKKKSLIQHSTCHMADPEGGTGVLDPHLENHKLSNTGLDSLKITKLPSQHSMLGHHWPVN